MSMRVGASVVIVAALTGAACGDESPAADSAPASVVLPSSVPVQTAVRLPATTVTAGP